MSQLYIDRGNTALKWQLVEDTQMSEVGTFSNDVALTEGLSILKNYRLTNIYVSSVASEKFHRGLIVWAKECGHPLPVFIESTRDACGVINAYQEAEQLGVDRWLAMIAAYHKYNGMLCVVDTGTALTMDFLLENGEHLGGFIVPGAELMKSSLLNNTQRINVDNMPNSNQLGKNTSEAVTFGIEQMLQLFVREKVAEMEVKYQQQMTLVLTGGHANVLAEGLSGCVQLEKDLVLQGLKLVSKSYK